MSCKTTIKITIKITKILRIEYSQNEDPEKFLANLIRTVEQSKANVSTIQPKKLHKLNFIAKLTTPDHEK